MKTFFYLFGGISFGLLVSGGIFAVLATVSMVPRFAGKTKTAKLCVLYEQMIVLGTIVGSFLTVFTDSVESLTGKLGSLGGVQTIRAINIMGVIIILMFGLFAGIFTGALAIGVAEMLDAIPILFRRVSIRHGMGIIVLAWALGKLIGSITYFAKGL